MLCYCRFFCGLRCSFFHSSFWLELNSEYAALSEFNVRYDTICHTLCKYHAVGANGRLGNRLHAIARHTSSAADETRHMPSFLRAHNPDGMVNVVVPPAMYEQCRQAIHSAFVIVEGVVQQDHGAINVLAAAVREV